ncbi:DUF4442 domain-containing protein [Agarivorans sp. MS3-6]
MDFYLKHARVTKTVLNLWPPFWGAGIKMTKLSPNFDYCEVRLAFRWWNKNANRSQFGGAIFSMTDPIYPLQLMAILGKQYHVWDSEAAIKFISPGRGKVYGRFILSKQFVENVKAQTAQGSKYQPKVSVEVVDEHGKLIAVVERTLYIRLKRQYRPVLDNVA